MGSTTRRSDPSGGDHLDHQLRRDTGLLPSSSPGRVPEIEPELARADIAVVPLRIGSGTRLKILESFAHRIPVVSTTVGADGLDVENGVHLLLADRPEDFALACRRLVEDPALTRPALVDAAEQRYLERYEWSVATSRIQQLSATWPPPRADEILSPVQGFLRKRLPDRFRPDFRANTGRRPEGYLRSR